MVGQVMRDNHLYALYQHHQLSTSVQDYQCKYAHSQYSRTPDLSQTHELICENISYSYADVLLKTNPFKVINNETI